jgi:hypothetical protein
LNASGVETSFLKDRVGPSWLHAGADPMAPVDVLVKRLQLEDARLVLAEIAYEQPFEPPAATSSHWRTAVVWWSAAIALGLAFTGISLARTSERIESCGLSLNCEEAGLRP